MISRHRRNPIDQRRKVRRRHNRKTLEALEPRCLLAGDVVINEIMYHPSSGKAIDEWIELYNPGDQAVNLSGFRVAGGVDFAFPAIELGAGEYLVVAADSEAFSSNYPDVTNAIGGWTGRLSNRSEEIEIRSTTDALVDRAIYADSGDWAARRREVNLGAPGWTWHAPHDGEGRSLELVNVFMPHTLGHNWATSELDGGTPGRANTVAADDAAPAIANVQHAPIIPTSADDVVVTARIVDERQDGISATLFYRESTQSPDAFSEIPMSDDGRHQDGRAGDGIFGATIPAFPDQTVVEFYVQASDLDGLVRTSPAASDEMGGQEANLLYQVDDVVRPDDVAMYRSIMTVPERRQFERQNRFSDAQMNATFIATVGGQTEVRYNVGVRYRGSGTRDNNPANNRINIPSDRPWNGITQMNINAASPRNQIAGSALMAMGGVAAADAIPVRMLGNGEDLGRGNYFAHIEVLNSDWADRHFPNDGNGNVYRGRRANEGPPGGLGAGLQYFGENQALYVSYLKGSNRSEADYSDVVNLTNVLNNTSDENYLEEVSKVVNIDQWLRAIAMIELSGYGEFGLLTGDRGGDDYAMYRGVDDPRFQMMPYDLDNMFTNIRGSLFRATNVPALNRFLSHPEIRQRYYAQLTDLMDHALTEQRLRPALEASLRGVEDPSRVDGILRFLERRIEFVRGELQSELTATSEMQAAGEYFRTSSAESGVVRGFANSVTTRRVEVNGIEANWDALESSWSISGIPLESGMNRLDVRSFDEHGVQTDQTSIGVWRDDRAATEISTAIDADTVWTAAEGPYQVSGNVRVAEGATLTVEPGTTVFFGPGARLSFTGRLVAVGTEQQPIWFTRVPGSASTWRGLQFSRSRDDNMIHHAVLEHGVTDDGMIGLENSRIELDHVTLANTDRRRIRTMNSSLVVKNSTFTPIALPGQPPATDNLSEHIWGQGIPSDGEWILENNTFGHLTGHNDAIDFDAPKRPNPIPLIRNNVFEGGGDDALDMTGDVYVEGNLFRNYIKDQFNIDPGESNTISASDGTFWVVRNVFANVQHVSLVKERAFMHFLNNTVVNAERSALYFDLPGQTSGPGRGARVEGSIFADTPITFDAVNANTDLTVTASFLNPAEAALGADNLSGDPLVGGPETRYQVLAGSPALGAGPGGIDLGASIPSGAIVLGEPEAVTSHDDAALTVVGPGLDEYRYRVNDGAWSDPQPIAVPIQLTDLADGEYVVHVIGRNAVGVWQEESAANSSRSWTVDSMLSRVRINEVLANNQGVIEHEGTRPDIVELYNEGVTPIDLSGMSLSDDATQPRRFVFPQGTVLAGQQYLVLYADDNFSAAGTHLGFALNADGEGVYLFDTAARGGQVVDAVEFGVQVADMSLGRDRSGNWTLNVPTIGAANRTRSLASPNALRINEWLADNEVLLSNDFVELYNPSSGPVELSGLFLTDHPIGWPDRHRIAPLSFIAARGHARFVADGDPQDGPDHVDFRVSRVQGSIALIDDGSQIDVVRYGPQHPDVSMGFAPDGSISLDVFQLPTPGLSNSTRTVENVSLVQLNGLWRYDQSGDDLGTEWREPDFDDAEWSTGEGALYVEGSDIPAPKNTRLRLGRTAYYFRHEFQVDSPSSVQSLSLSTVIDDGAVVYLNGSEVHRVGMPGGQIRHDTFADRTVSNASLEGPIEIPSEALVAGRNVLAVEVHQVNANSSDIVFALQLDAELQKVDESLSKSRQALDHLRLTEIMYNPIGGNDFEFLELQNIGTQPLELAGLRLEGAVNFVFPDLQLPPDEYVVVVNDLAAFRQRHGDTVRVAGEFSGNLSNRGEEISLRLPEPLPVNILNFEYSDQWHPATDGMGFSLVIDDPLAARRAWRNPAGWRPSNFVNGSPGFVDVGLDAGIIVINEVLANTDAAAGDQIELHNTTDANLDLSNWYLSNDAAELTKFRLPEATIIPPQGFALFSAADDFGQQFTLNDHGGVVLLSSPDAIADVAGFVESAEYGATDRNSSLGRVAISDGSFDFTRMSETTLGGENAPPSLESVVISEVMYDAQDGDEYIELHNRGDAAVSFALAEAPTRTWSLGGAVDFVFPPGAQIDPGAYVLVVGSDPAQFRSRRAVPDDVMVWGPYAGTLDDNGDDLRLLRPSSETNDSDVNIVVDRVKYSAEPPWPVESSDGVSALNREPFASYGNDPAHWRPSIAFGTPGLPNRDIDTSAPTVPSDVQWAVDVGPAINLSWVASTDPETGVANYRIYRDGEEVGTSSTTRFHDSSVAAPGSFEYRVSAINGQGIESALSPSLNVTLMSIESVISRFSDQLIVRFTEPVAREAAEATANYTIPNVDILSASLSDDGRSVLLSTSEMEAEVPHVLTIDNLVGVSGNPLPPGLEAAFSFREGVPGFTVRGLQTRRSSVRELSQVDQALSMSPDDRDIVAHDIAIYPTINFIDDDGHEPFSAFPDDVPFPTDELGNDDNVLIHATGFLTVTSEQAGMWTFGANIDAPDEASGQATLLPFGSSWKYLDDGSDLGTQWTQASFDDANWDEGPAQLGYGDGDESTVVEFGGDENNRFPTTYFRHRFEVPDPGRLLSVEGLLIKDDGAAVYLNGVEVARQNLRADATAQDFSDIEFPEFAENEPVRFAIDPALLRPGDNVLAVEVHQANAASDDLSFDMQLNTVVRQNGSSDGFRLRIDGVDVIAADRGNSDSDRLGSVLLERGAHVIDFVYFERSLGSEVELFAAPGEFTAFGATDIWRLVGDDANGGLRVRTDPAPPVSIDWNRVAPDGSSIFAYENVASLNGGDVPVGFETHLRAGEPLSVVVTPSTPDTTLSIKIRDDLRTFVTQTSTAAGQPVVISDFVPSTDGTYLIQVSGDVASEATVSALVNVAVEGELYDTAPSNDELGSAQSINATEQQLGNISRFAIRGRGDGIDSSDYFSVQLSAGDIVSVSNTLASRQASRLELLTEAGERVALGVDAEGVNTIVDYSIAADGIYFARVVADTDVEYTLVVTRNTGQDALINDSVEQARPFSPSLTMLGALGGASGSDGSVGGNVGLPAVLLDANGFLWDIQGDGSIGDGTSDAYDGGLQLSGFPGFSDGTYEDNDREVVIGPHAFSPNLTVTRKVFVSPDHSFARFLEVVTNTSSQAATVPLRIFGNMGSDNGTILVQTSSGDNSFDASDHWLVTDDADGSNDPTMLHIISGPGGLLPTSASQFSDQIDVAYELQLAPGETQVIMHFAAQNSDRETALALADELIELPSYALEGMNPEEMNQVVNFEVGDSTDLYSVWLSAGQTVTLTTETPASGQGSRTNSLDPLMSVFDPNGDVVVEDDNGADDGRNASVTFTASVDGPHLVRLRSAQGEGEYILRADIEALTTPPLTVVSTDPPLGAILNEIPAHFVVNFSSAIDLSSIQATDFQANGRPAMGVELVDGDSVRFQLNPSIGEGSNELVVALASAGLVDYFGNGNEAFDGQFSVDTVAPRVVSTTWNGQRFPATGVLGPGVLTLTVGFDETIRSADLTGEAVRLVHDATSDELPANEIEFDADTNTLTASFPFVPEGEYSLVIVSSDGAIEDIAGNDLDGEVDDSLAVDDPSGDGVAGGDFVVVFRVEGGVRDLSNQFFDLVPAGAAISQSQTFETISYGDDVDTFQLFTNPGDRLAVRVSPSQQGEPAGILTLEVRDPWSRIVGYGSADTAGDAVDLVGIQSHSGGRYEVRVTGDTIGISYLLHITKNAVEELIDSSESKPMALDASGSGAAVKRFAAIATSNSRNPSELVWGVQPATGSIVIIEPQTGVQVDRFSAPGNLSAEHTQIGLTMGETGQTLLYVNADDDPTRLYRLDPFTGEVKSTETVAGDAYDGLAFQRGKLFLGRDGVDVQRQTMAGDPPAPGWSAGSPTGGLAGDDYDRVFGYFTDGFIHEFDPTQDTDQFISDIDPPATDIEGLAFDHRFLYVATASGQLYMLDPDAAPEDQLLSTVDVDQGPLFGLAALTELAGNRTGVVAESESNNSVGRAQNLDEFFSLAENPNIGDNMGNNTSTSIPHVTVEGTGNGSFDFYSFTVENAGDRGIFDIDFGADSGGSIDSHLRLYSADGIIWSQNDDAPTDEGSLSSLDSFLEFTFPQPGLYAIEVGSCCVDGATRGATYELHVSIENHPLARASLEDLVATGSSWKYWDRAVSPPDGWSSEQLFDDSEWSEGRAQLGYGDGDEATEVSFGDDPANKPITSYYRKTFTVRDPARFSTMWLDLQRDDGAAVYLNGTRIALDNLPDGAGPNDPASVSIDGDDELTLHSFEFDPALLREGENVVAVEIHQAAPDDDDASFDLRLRGEVLAAAVQLPIVPETDIYTLDLTGHGGTTIDVILTSVPQFDLFGQPIEIGFSDQKLRLLDPSGSNVLAEATSTVEGLSPTNYDLAILGFEVPEDGVYQLALESTITAEYTLLVIQDAAFDTERNDEPDQIVRMLAPGQSALGHLTGPGPSSIVDPRGDVDSFNQQAFDISSVMAEIEGRTLVLTMEFYESILPTSPDAGDGAFGFFELDIDQDASTGRPSFRNQAGVPGASLLGVEFGVSFNSVSLDSAFLFDQRTNEFVDNVPMVLTATSVRIEVPLSSLDRDEGSINLGAFVGGFGINDSAPNDTFLTTRQADGTIFVSGDTYRVNLQEGQTLLAATESPSDRIGRAHPLDVALQIADANGTVLVSDEDSSADGVNSALLFTAPATADYFITVIPQAGAGGYLFNQQLFDAGRPMGRFLFYNHSTLDGDDPNANAQDDKAIAFDKFPLLGDRGFLSANYTNYARGINGLMIDLPNLGGVPSAEDFEFRVGNDQQPASWELAAPPRSIDVRQGEGIAGSDRVTIIWDDHAIENQWLQVLVKANNTTGLTEDDVFYFGNLVGETGDLSEMAEVTTRDQVGVRNHLGGENLAPQQLQSFDFNRDGQVNATDLSFVSGRRSLVRLLQSDPPVPQKETPYGDANLDGRLSTDDLLLVLQAAEFEDRFPGNSTWSEGDFDGDGDFTTADLVLLFKQGGFEQAAAGAARAQQRWIDRSIAAVSADDEDRPLLSTGAPWTALQHDPVNQRRIDLALSGLDLLAGDLDAKTSMALADHRADDAWGEALFQFVEQNDAKRFL